MGAINWDQIAPQHPQPGITTHRRDFTYMTVVRYQFEPGATFPLHHHPEEQVLVVQSGTVQFTVGEQTVSLRPGDSLCASPNVPHGGTAGPQGVVFLNITSPKRTGENTIQFTEARA